MTTHQDLVSTPGSRSVSDEMAYADDALYYKDARYFEYSAAADPMHTGTVTRVPIRTFSPELYEEPKTQIVPLDVSAELRIAGPATSPGLCANFVRVLPGEAVAVDVNATSLLFFALSGSGHADADGVLLPWSENDYFVLPNGKTALHAHRDSVLYLVHDAPLLDYLGVRPHEPRFRPTLFLRERSFAELAKVRAAAEASTRNRVSVLLANAAQDQTRTITHVLWAMLGVVPAHQMQRPHRHQSVALDLVLEATEGCYTLIGKELDKNGDIKDPVRVDWITGGAFITPPGLWHGHYNDSGTDSYVIPIQDAGLHTYLRSLDIRFSHPPR